MKTTLDLPDELIRAIKVRAAQQGRKIKDVVAELLLRGLQSGEPAGVPAQRVQLPLVHCARPARPELTPERVAAALVDQDAEWAAAGDDAAV
ncbi:antitoxin [Mycobacterium sp. pUA109]|uniref:antitoxin n=1 Tax=Mycobacterium sp. pUA109 TaxID=3238982 RepID=UPI00351B02EB